MPKKEEMERDAKKLIDTILENGGQLEDVHKINDQRAYCEDLAQSGNIKALPDVMHQILTYFYETRDLGLYYKIIDDDHFETSVDDSQLHKK